MLNSAGLIDAIVNGTWRMRAIYDGWYLPIAVTMWLLGAAGWLPRVRPSTRGEGTERRYFYGSVWAVCIAQPMLWFLWKVVPAGRPGDVFKLLAFWAVLAYVGNLARRGISAVLPTMEEFSYVMRVVSEILESNGSSSMASVCGTSLALMDAGVPVKAHVAGIAMGLIKEGNRFAVLSDILGDEDHLGDMDFKVAGTETGITALQMDLKIESIGKGIMKIALDQAREARLGILQVMKGGIEGSRSELSSFAPRIIKIKINPDKIRDVIGKGGVVIRGIQEETGTTIEIEDDGTIAIACVSAEGGEAARKRIMDITADVEVGKVYEGPVLRLLDFGAIVQLLPGRDGLLHISQISHERVNAVSDHLKEGQIVKVKVLEADDKGRVRLSMKAVGAPEAAKQA